jgi:predicted RNA-binding protein
MSKSEINKDIEPGSGIVLVADMKYSKKQKMEGAVVNEDVPYIDDENEGIVFLRDDVDAGELLGVLYTIDNHDDLYCRIPHEGENEFWKKVGTVTEAQEMDDSDYE